MTRLFIWNKAFFSLPLCVVFAIGLLERTSLVFTLPGAPNRLVKFLERGAPVNQDAVHTGCPMAYEAIELAVDLRDDGKRGGVNFLDERFGPTSLP
ncbi:hypothetical protein LY78DRAFT_659934 [Colletotrichum sublineola]|nr:hypothetical protein LY78DRAFT_659934 [Colletotrichum sublineola]